MGRKKRNTVQKTVHMHINVVPTVREIAKYLSDIEIKKEIKAVQDKYKTP